MVRNVVGAVLVCLGWGGDGPRMRQNKELSSRELNFSEADVMCMYIDKVKHASRHSYRSGTLIGHVGGQTSGAFGSRRSVDFRSWRESLSAEHE